MSLSKSCAYSKFRSLSQSVFLKYIFGIFLTHPQEEVWLDERNVLGLSCIHIVCIHFEEQVLFETVRW